MVLGVVDGVLAVTVDGFDDSEVVPSFEGLEDFVSVMLFYALVMF
jgi:hypothetical protein